MAIIYVPALIDGDKVVVPQFWLAEDIEHRLAAGDPLSAAGYNAQMKLPALADLRHAFFASPRYRQSVLPQSGDGEWTSTFLVDGKRAVEWPEKVYFVEEHELWVAEGGKDTKVELPPDGWTLEYDKPTGFSSRTSPEREDAKKVFGDDTAYFYRVLHGVRAVLRVSDKGNKGAFYIDAASNPGFRHSAFGGREKYPQALTEDPRIDGVAAKVQK